MNEDLNAAVAASSPSREEWKFPLWARFKSWVIGFGGAALLIVGCLYAFYLYQRPDVTYVETKPVIADMGIPISQPAKQLSVKTATKNKAEKAINTPARVEISPEIIPSAAPPEPLTPAEQDFANRLANFERPIQ